MRTVPSSLIAGLALVSTVSAQAATPAPCIRAAEMHGLIAYFLPDVVGKVLATCSDHLPPGSYLRAGLPHLVEPLNAGKNAAWPTAKAAFFKLGEPEDVKTVDAVPDDALRPLIEAAVVSALPIELTPVSCADVNDVAEALAPLDATQTVHLAATIFTMISRKDGKLRGCGRENN